LVTIIWKWKILSEIYDNNNISIISFYTVVKFSCGTLLSHYRTVGFRRTPFGKHWCRQSKRKCMNFIPFQEKPPTCSVSVETNSCRMPIWIFRPNLAWSICIHTST
jgi:hypothetical protein